MKKPPCKDCKDRHRACHDECERYKAFKNYLAKIREAKIEEAKQFAGLEINKGYKARRQQR